MGLFDFLKTRPKQSAQTARERLLILVTQERSTGSSPDYLPTLKRELLEVIRKYVNVDPDAVQIDVQHDGDQEVLEFSVTLPDKKS